MNKTLIVLVVCVQICVLGVLYFNSDYWTDDHADTLNLFDGKNIPKPSPPPPLIVKHKESVCVVGQRNQIMNATILAVTKTRVVLSNNDSLVQAMTQLRNCSGVPCLANYTHTSNNSSITNHTWSNGSYVDGIQEDRMDVNGSQSALDVLAEADLINMSSPHVYLLTGPLCSTLSNTSRVYIDPPDKLVVANAADDDMRWLLSSRYPSIVYERIPTTRRKIKFPLLLPNRGNEAHGYLRFIIDYYDILPNHVAFIHGHQASWHDPNTLESLNRLKWGSRPYLNFSPLHYQKLGEGNRAYELPKIQKFWKSAGLDSYLGSCPPVLYTECCAHFAVTREQILKHPQRFYIHLLDWLINQEDFTNHDGGVLLEWIWGMIFGEPYNMRRRSTCDVFDCS
eukprot:GILK01012408.1.p1 GENE.GILK01012408.1~~GILK01012408.1.p1  ORF type:complete len:395 (+),score=51.21 GILK01012408.1:38-1222(+)